MTKTVLFTDPHLGVDRVAHTTTRSRKLLRENLFQTSLSVVREARELKADIFCLGDLFDTFSNKEEVILQGAMVARECNLVLGGNHDQINNVEIRGSLELLKTLFEEETYIENDLNIEAALFPPKLRTSIVLSENRSEPYSESFKDVEGNVTYTTVPHAMTQELFVASLDNAALSAPSESKWTNILLLHCNVGEPHEHNLTDAQTALWLTPELQDKMLDKFDFVLIGHEHVPQSLHGGRLLVLGNIYPIGFGEIADRFYYVFDSHTKTIEAVKLADMEKEYKEFPVEEFMQLEGKIECSQSMIQIKGTIKPSEYPDFARCLTTFWKTNPQLFAVNANVEALRGGKAEVDKATFVPRTLPEIVAESIKSTPFSEAYKDIVEKLDEEETEEL